MSAPEGEARPARAALARGRDTRARAERPTAPSTLLARHAGALVAVAFLALGIATLGDWGITWDEPESYVAGIVNLATVRAVLTGAPRPAPAWHELPGYQFAADTARGALAEIFDGLFWTPHDVLGYHLVNLLMVTGAVLLLALLARREGSALLAPLAALFLVLQPKLVAHSQANPKDGVALLLWTAAMLALTRAARRRRWRDFGLLGITIGAAMASHVTAVLLLPIAAIWVLLGVATGDGEEGDQRDAAGGVGAGVLASVDAGESAEARASDGPAPAAGWRSRLPRALGGLVLVGVLALATTLLLWPWLWRAPLTRGLFLVHHVAHFEVAMRVLYLGRLYAPTALPWHYSLVSLLLATPVVVLLLVALGVGRALRRADSGARLARLAVLWFLVPLVADARAPAHYDGARHLLPALPALALLAGLGAEWLLRAARSPRRRAVTLATLAAACLAVGVDLASMHPYADAYLDLPARLWLGPEAEHQVELEYWCNSYREAAAWIVAHTVPDTVVLVPMGSHAMVPLLEGRRTVAPEESWPESPRPQVLVLMTREAWYTPGSRARVAAARPLFTVRRQGSTLLAIYRVRRAPTPRRRALG